MKKAENTGIYGSFAYVYDIFMDNVPYEEWTKYLVSLLHKYDVKEGLIAELGCGTGSITRRLSDAGYDMIGIDNSWEMLEIAREKEYENMPEEDCEGSDFEEEDSIWEEEKSPILYLQQDMREFELFGTVNGVVSICDSMNYITKEEDLLKVFRLVNNYLEPGGIFIFDMNTEYKYKSLLANNVIAENREDCSFIWENYYEEETGLNEYNVTVFVKWQEEAEEEKTTFNGETKERNLFQRFSERHVQKAYSLEKVKELLEKAGMEFLQAYDAFTHNPPTEISERVYFIAKEKFQQNKKYV